MIAGLHPADPASPRGTGSIYTRAGSGSMGLKELILFSFRPNLMSSFRFQARYGLFTYPQSDGLDPFRVSDHFSSLSAECIVARENHQDGGTHLHAFVDFGKKYRTRDVRKFDVENFHPNIQPTISSPRAGWDYATKDGEICAGGLQQPDDAPCSQGNRQNDNWHLIVNAPDREQFFDLLRELEPRYLATCFNSLQKYAEWNYRVDRAPYQPNPEHTFDTSQYPALWEWVRRYLHGNRRGKLISRPAGAGGRWPYGPFPSQSADPPPPVLACGAKSNQYRGARFKFTVVWSIEDWKDRVGTLTRKACLFLWIIFPQGI